MLNKVHSHPTGKTGLGGGEINPPARFFFFLPVLRTQISEEIDQIFLRGIVSSSLSAGLLSTATQSRVGQRIFFLLFPSFSVQTSNITQTTICYTKD